MKDAHRADIKNGKVKNQCFWVEVELMWQKGSLWKSAAKTLMNTMYFHNGNIFGFRAAAHRITRTQYFILGDEFIQYTYNSSKTHQGRLRDL